MSVICAFAALSGVNAPASQHKARSLRNGGMTCFHVFISILGPVTRHVKYFHEGKEKMVGLNLEFSTSTFVCAGCGVKQDVSSSICS